MHDNDIKIDYLKVFDSLGKTMVDSTSKSTTDDTDVDLVAKGKREKQIHENTKSRLDGWLQNITHPFVLSCVVVAVFIIERTVHYVGVYKDSEFILSIADDIKTTLSYIFTVVITSIFTSFIEHFQNKK